MFNVSVISLAESGYFVRLGTIWFPDVHSVRASMLLKRKEASLSTGDKTGLEPTSNDKWCISSSSSNLATDDDIN